MYIMKFHSIELCE